MHYENGGDRDRGRGSIASGLGWFSIGLGLAELAAPGQIARLIGFSDDDKTRTLLRLYGVREIAAGVGILSNTQQPQGWLWGRVAGDLVDLATLASGFRTDEANRTRVATATTMVAGVTALDILCARRSGESEETDESRGVHVVRVITVNKPVEEVYRFWRDLENLPTFMKHVESVRSTGHNRSHWKAIGPAGMKFEWDAEMTEDRPNSRLAWRSLPGSDIDNAGAVSFESATGDRGTVVRVELDYAPPGGALGAGLAKLFGREPSQQIHRELRAFKQIMETGEVVASDASVHEGMHAAQPAEEVMAY